MEQLQKSLRLQKKPIRPIALLSMKKKKQLKGSIELYQLSENYKAIGCIAIEKLTNEIDTFYIEKLSVTPEYRHKGYGTTLIEFAAMQIIKHGGKTSMTLIDSNT